MSARPTRHGIPSFCAMSHAHAVTPRNLRFEHPFTVHVCATDEARDSQLLCYEPCTCRYTQKSSTSNIPSPCISARPDEARDSQLLCYEPCTCRYTQNASTSNIPSPCMSGRPDEARDSQLLCYEPCTCRYTQTPPLRTSLHRACLRDRTRPGFPASVL